MKNKKRGKEERGERREIFCIESKSYVWFSRKPREERETKKKKKQSEVVIYIYIYIAKGRKETFIFIYAGKYHQAMITLSYTYKSDNVCNVLPYIIGTKP